ncbi:GntR family transcriptional regulator [Actinoallomurus iriomotensis]|uniref:Transcriptional regulator n=1 Tax=Actinoallomurus iriomotensis TaxID=478107 RepID=A0A9W6RXA6_9ACTN|nr:transcriptional regulator [Actinoallomurus iriomotensis]
MEPIAKLITIDRSSPVPLYFQVAERLQDLIESGTLAQGVRLENEITLADQLGVSRPTMRQAIQHLVDKGMLARKRGFGTQVVHNRVRRQVELTSLYEDLSRDGREPRTEVLSFHTVPAGGDVAAALQVEPGAEVLSVRRLRYAGDEPLAIMHNHLPAGLIDVTEDDLNRRGLYELLRAVGVTIQIAEQAVGARRATAGEARLLGETRGAPLLTMSRTAYDDAGRPIEYGSHLYRADLYSFEMTLRAR